MRNRIAHYLFGALWLLFLLFGTVTTCQATPIYTNEETGYRIEIIDEAQLLSPEDEIALIPYMMPITTYGNVAFVTVDYTGETAEDNARDYYMDLFGTDSGTLFLIDMSNRYIWIHSDGEIYKTLNTDYANSITDNAYELASDCQYLSCAQSVFEQIYTLLEGGRIAQPMKYICNIIIGLILSVFILFTWMSIFAYRKRPKSKEMLAIIDHSFQYEYRDLRTLRAKRELRSQSSSGGVFRSRGGSRGSGGFRSGGGGGHRF